MSQPNETDQRRTDLQALLEVYGADRSRWPAADRLQLAGLIATDHDAKALFNEAVALDRLLDLAPVVSIERERALAQRILAAVQSSNGRPAIQDETVVPLRPATRPIIPQWRGRARHAGAALLAASLVLGVFAGATGQLSSTIDVLAEAAGLSDDESELAFIADASTSGEEAL